MLGGRPAAPPKAQRDLGDKLVQLRHLSSSLAAYTKTERLDTVADEEEQVMQPALILL